MTWLSNDARKVEQHLGRLGIELGDQAFRLQCLCIEFFPNHIIGVIDQCLKKGKRAEKMEKAQAQGLEYFVQPIYNMLQSRPAAIRPKRMEQVDVMAAYKIWKLAQARLLMRDMDEEEVYVLLVTIPRLGVSDADIQQGIAVCRNRDARSPRYLHGILRRSIQERAGKRRERKDTQEQEQQIWFPESDPLTRAQRAQLIADWQTRQRSIEVMKDLRRYAQEH